MGDQKSDQILTADYFSFGLREKQQKMDFSMQIGDVVCLYLIHVKSYVLINYGFITFLGHNYYR